MYMTYCTLECTSPIDWDKLIYSKINEYLDGIEEQVSVLDIGANIGSFITNVGILPKIKNIYGIEPDKTNFNLLQQNIQRANISNVKLLNYAVSDKVEEVNIYSGNGTCETFNILNSNNNEHIRSRVKSVTLDFLSNKLQQTFDVIKIDVEGAETKVIIGGINTIKNCKRVFLEIHNNTTFIEILKIVNEQKWKIKCLKNNHLINQKDSKIDFCYQVIIQP